MARIAWVFEDEVEGTTERMEINPNEGCSPTYQKTLVKKTTTAGNRVLLSEGQDVPQQLDFSGVILTQNQYEFLRRAWAKRHLVRLTDDLGRVFVIYFESFAPKRKLSHNHPWRHEYQATTVIVG